MGFFKNLFEKKTCDLCGGEIGLLGNRKLEDGNCCKECAKKLSPWFTDRKNSTVAEIRQQLASREANRQAVAAFHRTRAYGKNMMVYIDQDAGKFMVTDARDLEEANPDVLDFSQVTSCDVNVVEAKNEVYCQVRNGKGELVNESFSPRRFRYSYDFQMKIGVNHPYIEQIAFSLSGGYFPVRVSRRDSGVTFLFGKQEEEYGPDGSSSAPPTQADFQANDDYVRYECWGRELREILLGSPRPVPGDENSLSSLVEQCRAAEKACKKARTAGDSLLTMETMKVLDARKRRLQEVYLDRLRGDQRSGEDRFTALVSDYRAVEEDMAAAEQSADADRIYAAATAREVLMQRAAEARTQDPEGFRSSGFLELLQQTSPGTPAQAKPVTCPYCGSQVKAGRFCENCGAKLD